MSQQSELLWVTDPHLDHVGHPDAATRFGQHLRRLHPDAAGLIVTGDIAEGPTVLDILRQLKTGFVGPVYFVLGNHDYYRGSFAKVDAELSAALCGKDSKAHWLRSNPTWLLEAPEKIALVGNGGFYDGRYGNSSTTLELTDFSRIEELFCAQDKSRAALFQTIAQRADKLATELSSQLKAVLGMGARVVIVATHVPPFRESAFYEGRPSDDHWAPFFSSRVMGEVLLEAADAHHQTRFLVLCGHTHGSGRYQPRDNLEVVTGCARYGAPGLAGRISIKTGKVLDLKKG